MQISRARAVVIKGAGFDEIWFGIFLVLAVAKAQITPPVGFNLFVIRGPTKDGLGDIARVTLPYPVIMVGFVLLLTPWPGIITILPRVLYGSTEIERSTPLSFHLRQFALRAHSVFARPRNPSYAVHADVRQQSRQ